MSGGFFRGTSADQDTRFSNKQAKLLKSQKFAPELENLVDMTRVKMDVMRPWIAKRVTELIGFEDEVLINFIYTLLEGKAVNGKQIQISLTGFMERNTGKFMKELWVLLLSAQQNVSGVPQQFLDAKEEEAKKKRAENDHAINEMKEEKPEVEKTLMEGGGTFLKDRQADLEFEINKDTDISRIQPDDEKDQYKRNGRRRISSRKHSMSPSKSSNSRSYSDERRKSRSVSRTPPSRSRSISSERRQRSSPRRSVTPRRKHSYGYSTTKWRRSTYSKRRSPSPSRYMAYSPPSHISRSSRYRSRSPVRRRSRTPMRYRSRTPLQHRSPSPRRRRSPSPRLRRSPSPRRRRSPSPRRHRSPSPRRRRSPTPRLRRSPTPRLRRSPSPKEISPSFGRRKILSPVYHSSISPDHHSPSPVYQRSPSPHRRVRSPARRRYRHSSSSPHEKSLSPVQHRSSVYNRKRSIPSRGKSPPQELNSPVHIHHNSVSPVKEGSPKSPRSPIKSVGGKARISGKYSPARCGSLDKRAELPVGNHKGVISSDSRPVVSLRSPQRDILEQDDPEINEKGSQPSVRRSALLSDTGEGRRNSGKYKYRSPDKLSPSSVHRKDVPDSVGTHVFTDETKLIKSQLPNREMLFDMGGDKEYHESAIDKNKAPKNHSMGTHWVPELEVKQKRPENSNQNESMVSPPEEADGLRVGDNEKRKHKKLDKQELKSGDDASYDSYEDRKEAKRRRKEEKKLKKGDRRRRREEKRRKRDERRAEKLKLKSGDVSSSSSDHGPGHSGDEVRRQESRRMNVMETESDQRKLEIELREKALESLRAKKGVEN